MPHGHHDSGDLHRNDEAIVELGRLPGIVEAEALMAELKGQGIRSSLNQNDLGGMRPHLGYVQGVSVYVFENDAEVARRIARDVGIEI